MSKPINNARYQTFLKQARGAEVREVHVSRLERGKPVVLQYNARTKTRGRLAGEWAIDRGEDPAALEAEIKTALAMLRKDFFVRRGDGLTGEAYADAAQDAPVEPIRAAEPGK